MKTSQVRILLWAHWGLRTYPAIADPLRAEAMDVGNSIYGVHSKSEQMFKLKIGYRLVIFGHNVLTRITTYTKVGNPVNILLPWVELVSLV